MQGESMMNHTKSIPGNGETDVTILVKPHPGTDFFAEAFIELQQSSTVTFKGVGNGVATAICVSEIISGTDKGRYEVNDVKIGSEPIFIEGVRRSDPIIEITMSYKG